MLVSIFLALTWHFISLLCMPFSTFISQTHFSNLLTIQTFPARFHLASLCLDQWIMNLSVIPILTRSRNWDAVWYDRQLVETSHGRGLSSLGFPTRPCTVCSGMLATKIYPPSPPTEAVSLGEGLSLTTFRTHFLQRATRDRWPNSIPQIYNISIEELAKIASLYTLCFCNPLEYEI